MNVEELNEENFKEKVLNSEDPFLVCFTRPGCPACLTIIPILEEVSKEAKVGILDIYESPEVSSKYKIPAVPTLIIFKGGKPKERAVGVRQKEVLINKLCSLKSD